MPLLFDVCTRRRPLSENFGKWGSKWCQEWFQAARWSAKGVIGLPRGWAEAGDGKVWSRTSGIWTYRRTKTKIPLHLLRLLMQVASGAALLYGLAVLCSDLEPKM